MAKGLYNFMFKAPSTKKQNNNLNNQLSYDNGGPGDPPYDFTKTPEENKKIQEDSKKQKKENIDWNKATATLPFIQKVEKDMPSVRMAPYADYVVGSGKPTGKPSYEDSLLLHNISKKRIKDQLVFENDDSYYRLLNTHNSAIDDSWKEGDVKFSDFGIYPYTPDSSEKIERMDNSYGSATHPIRYRNFFTGHHYRPLRDAQDRIVLKTGDMPFAKAFPEGEGLNEDVVKTHHKGIELFKKPTGTPSKKGTVKVKKYLNGGPGDPPHSIDTAGRHHNYLAPDGSTYPDFEGLTQKQIDAYRLYNKPKSSLQLIMDRYNDSSKINPDQALIDQNNASRNNLAKPGFQGWSMYNTQASYGAAADEDQSANALSYSGMPKGDILSKERPVLSSWSPNDPKTWTPDWQMYKSKDLDEKVSDEQKKIDPNWQMYYNQDNTWNPNDPSTWTGASASGSTGGGNTSGGGSAGGSSAIDDEELKKMDIMSIDEARKNIMGTMTKPEIASEEDEETEEKEKFFDLDWEKYTDNERDLRDLDEAQKKYKNAALMDQIIQGAMLGSNLLAQGPIFQPPERIIAPIISRDYDKLEREREEDLNMRTATAQRNMQELGGITPYAGAIASSMIEPSRNKIAAYIDQAKGQDQALTARLGLSADTQNVANMTGAQARHALALQQFKENRGDKLGEGFGELVQTQYDLAKEGTTYQTLRRGIEDKIAADQYSMLDKDKMLKDGAIGYISSEMWARLPSNIREQILGAYKYTSGKAPVQSDGPTPGASTSV